MKNLYFILLGLAAWAILVVISPSKTPEPELPKAPAATEQPRSSARRDKERAAKAGASEVASDSSATAAHREEAQAVIDAAAVTYSPEGVQAIRPFLLDSDPEVRMAARDGMVQLGEVDAVPLLRAAAGKLKDQLEIASFHEAADLLALPPWSETTEAQDTIAEIIEEMAR